MGLPFWINKNMNKWQNDILSALEKKGTFIMDYWNNELNADKEGFVFMQSVAQSLPVYSYLDSLGLVNRGFCPITEEKSKKGGSMSAMVENIFIPDSELEINYN